MVFRCRSKCNRPVDLSGVGVSVVLRDMNGVIAFQFSNIPDSDARELLVRDNCVICSLSNEDMAEVVGCYVVEVKVRVKNVVMVAVSRKIRVFPSVIGEDLNL